MAQEKHIRLLDFDFNIWLKQNKNTLGQRRKKESREGQLALLVREGQLICV